MALTEFILEDFLKIIDVSAGNCIFESFLCKVSPPSRDPAPECKTWLFDEMLYMSWIRKIPFYSNNQFTKVGFVQNGVDKTHSQIFIKTQKQQKRTSSIANRILTFLSCAFSVWNRILFLLADNEIWGRLTHSINTISNSVPPSPRLSASPWCRLAWSWITIYLGSFSFPVCCTVQCLSNVLPQ